MNHFTSFRRSAACAASFVALVAAGASPASADALTSALGEPLFETSHDVEIRVAAGVATWTVHRVITNEGVAPDEASLLVDLPGGSAMTSLRVRFGDTWASTVLRSPADADLLFQGGESDGVFSGMAALAEFSASDAVQLTLYPVQPGGAVEIEYTLLGLAPYEGGRWVVGYPRASLEAAASATPVLRVTGDKGAPVASSVDGHRVPAGASTTLRGAPATAPAGGFAGRTTLPGVLVDSLTVSAGDAVATVAAVTVEIHHPHAGDVGLTLVTPRGDEVELRLPDGLPGAGISKTLAAKFASQPASGPWGLRVTDEAPGDTGLLRDWKLSVSTKEGPRTAEHSPAAAIPDGVFHGPEHAAINAYREARIEVWTPMAAGRDGLGVRYATVAAGGARLSSLWVEVAPALRPTPKAPAVVFLLDASVSVRHSGLAAQLAAIAAFLAVVPDARFEIVVFRRTAERLAGRLVPAAELPAVLKAARAAGHLELGNGSALDVALSVATEVLRGHKGPAAVVALTDGLARARLEAGGAAAALRVPATVPLHLVRARGGPDPAELTRDPEGPLAEAAAAHGGAFFELVGAESPRVKEVRWAVRELVRPTRIEDFEILGLGDVAAPAELDEGVGIHRTIHASAADAKPSGKGLSPVVVRGKIWGRPFERKVVSMPALVRPAVATAVGEDLLGDLDAGGTKIVRDAGVVSYVSSLVVARPGARPGRGGYASSRDGGGPGGIMGTGTRTGGGRPPAKPDLVARLKAGVDGCVATHRPPKGWTVNLAIETTLEEVVDVEPDTGPDPFTTCVIEAAWALRLDPKTFWLERWSHDVSLSAAK